MMQFHYHYWTYKVEQTEQFYAAHGFQVTGRYAKGENGVVTYHPPLTWDDFRTEQPVFRIVEAVRGKINVTFGAGKKPMFDHIGFLVTHEEHAMMCEKARKAGWKVSIGERRTFIGTPLRLRIELQQNPDAVHHEKDEIKGMIITSHDSKEASAVSKFLEPFAPDIIFTKGEQLALEEVRFETTDIINMSMDPNGVKVAFTAMV